MAPAPSGEVGLALRAAVASDRGRVRADNQDAALADPERGLFVVSDGMGGQQGGGVASRLVVGLLPALLEGAGLGATGAGPDPAREVLAIRQAVLAVNAQVRARGAHDGPLRGLGATLALALLRGPAAHIAHLGDSRAYLLRGQRLQCLTADHTLAAAVTPLAGDGRARHRLTRCVGMAGDATPEVRTVPLEAGDRLLLCTDGVTGALPDRLIAHLLRRQPGPDEACRVLVGAACSAGGRDNATAVVVYVGVPPAGAGSR